MGGRHGGGGAGARAPAGCLAGRVRGRERAAGTKQGRPRPDREPGSGLSLAFSSHPWLPLLGAGVLSCKIWETSTHTVCSLFSLLSFFSFLYLPSLPLPGLPYRGWWLLPPRCLSGSPRHAVGAAGAGWRGAGPGAIAGFSLGCGSGGGGGGRGSPARAAPELVGDLGSFLLLGSTFLSTARHCLHYFS